MLSNRDWRNAVFGVFFRKYPGPTLNGQNDRYYDTVFWDLYDGADEDPAADWGQGLVRAHSIVTSSLEYFADPGLAQGARVP